MSDTAPIICVSTSIALADQLVKLIEHADRSKLKQIAAGLEVELVKVKNEMLRLHKENEDLKAAKV